MSPQPISLKPRSQLHMQTIQSGEVSNYTVDVAWEVRSQPGLIGSKIEGKLSHGSCYVLGWMRR